jgi:hypothetical protein
MILRNPDLQSLPPDLKEEMATRISQLKGVNLDGELEELDRHMGHYSYCITQLGSRFRWRGDYYIKRNVWGNDGDGPRDPMDRLVCKMRQDPIHFVSQDDQDVARVIAKRYIDELEERREEDKRITIEERWANAETYTLDDD